MEVDSKDNDVFRLLKKLKEANGTYPQEMLTLRRQGYLRQVAEVGAGGGLALGLKNTIKSAKGIGRLPSAASTLVETFLVVAIVAEASAVAYLYRNKLNDLIQNTSRSPKVEEIANPPIVSSPLPEFESTLTLSPEITVTETETPVVTPTLQLAGQPTNPGGGQGSSAAVSTPGPNGADPNENNGNQYGLTPKPERTKEPGNDTSNRQRHQ